MLIGVCGTDGSAIMEPKIVPKENKTAEIEILTEIIDTRQEHYWQHPAIINNKNICCPVLVQTDLPKRSDNSMQAAAEKKFPDAYG